MMARPAAEARRRPGRRRSGCGGRSKRGAARRIEREASSRRGRRQQLEALRLVKESLCATGRAAQAIALLERTRQQLGPRLPAGADLLNDIADCYERLATNPRLSRRSSKRWNWSGTTSKARLPRNIPTCSIAWAQLPAPARVGPGPRQLAARGRVYEKLCEAPADDDRRRAVRAGCTRNQAAGISGWKTGRAARGWPNVCWNIASKRCLRTIRRSGGAKPRWANFMHTSASPRRPGRY